MPELVVEIHFPLTPDPNVPEGDYRFPWIDEVTEALIELEEDGEVAVFDDSEEVGDDYVYFIAGGDEASLLAIAGRLATLPGAPAGVFAVVTDDESGEIGEGRRVDIT